MTSKQVIAAAAALALSIGASVFASGSAAADPMQFSQAAWRGGETVYGYTGVNDGSASRASGACESRLGGAILGGFADASDAPQLGSKCRY